MNMTDTAQDPQTNILRFVPAAATWQCVTVAQHFGATPVVPDHEGAQTSSQMLDFLYRVAR